MRLIRTLLISAMLLGGSAGLVYAAEPDMAAQIESATTPQQHQQLADEYRAKAAESRERAEKHRGMAKMYERGKQVVSQARHCNMLAKRYDENAADYDAMAEAHAAQAKK